MRQLPLKLITTVIFLLLLNSGAAFSQASGCDEGVIRLPDRSGTIQICSALSARVPQLTRQLNEMSKGHATQNQQIAELTRLVRGLNNVSRGLDTGRQGKMLESLSLNLTKKKSEPGVSSKEILDPLINTVDELQSKMFAAISSPASAAALSEAMKGALGDAIAKLDLSSANQQLSEISERLKIVQAEVTEIKSDTSAIRAALVDLSKEIKTLSGLGGLVAEPKSYPEHYHNARIYAQRGEVDLSLASYRKVLVSPIQLADPIIDVTTLLVRMYGREGAEKYVDRNLKGIMSTTSYIYARQLLSLKQSKLAYELMLNNKNEFLRFPPLGALYFRKIEDKNEIDQDSFPWSDWVMLLSVFSNVQNAIETGDYLSYFADQIRGGNDIEAFDQIRKYFDQRKILVKLLPNHNGEKFAFTRRAVDIQRSPVVLDFTYYFEGPNSSQIGGSWFSIPMGPKYMNKPFIRSANRFDILIWDVAIDRSKPIEVCALNGASERCIDFSAVDKVCQVSRNVEGGNCLRKFADQGTYVASARIHITPAEILGNACLSRIRYSDEDGRVIDIPYQKIISTFRGPGSQALLSAMKSCGYSTQVDNEVRSNRYF
jgi:hypothetical protein